MNDIAAAIIIAALVCSLAYCADSDNRARNDELKLCLDHGGYKDGWSGQCKIKGRNA